MTHSYWLAQTVSVSTWLIAGTDTGVTSVDLSPGVFTRGDAAAPNNAAKRPRILVMLAKYSTM